ncbi:hypothetical protein THRCLA_07223 [Thraustotheca clavata]|uniref:FYVE-type domain-containing protein n=1 Tax=Thraustotheca clavata TaxID=74557 RepID=A0A1V9ZFF0_9STRA|nr:hypothetical protein THRCLA_07223 [Thraustotheca clavata]
MAMAMSSYNHIFVDRDAEADQPSRILRQDQLMMPHLYQSLKGCHACHECTKAFNAFRRKYNCQMCGQVVCKNCTLAHVAEVSNDVLDVKVCLSCVANLEAEHKLRRTNTSNSLRASTELGKRRSSRSNASISRSSDDDIDAGMMTLTIRGKETHIRRTSGSVDYSLDFDWKHKWPKPPILPREIDRLKVLKSFDLLHREFNFDAVTEIAAKVLQCPIVIVGFIDEYRHWFKASRGLAQQHLPRSMSFCAHALASEEPLVVLDALADERFKYNPMVTGAGIRFYASAPIIHASGHILGTVAVMDQKPRTTCDPSILETLASVVMKKVEAVQAASNTAARRKAASVSSNSDRQSNSGHAIAEEDEDADRQSAPSDMVFTDKDMLHRSVWVADTKRFNCFVCKSKFSMFLRKHHCRMCGEVVCKNCVVSASVTMDIDKVVKVPVCLACLARKKLKESSTQAPPQSPEKRTVADSVMTVDEEDDDDAIPVLDRHMAFDVDACEVISADKPLILDPPPMEPELQRDISRNEIESMLAKLLSQSTDIQNQLSSVEQLR